MSTTLEELLEEERREQAPGRRGRFGPRPPKSQERDQAAAPAEGTVTSWTSGRRWHWWERWGFLYPRQEGIRTTTHQCEATYLAVAAPPTSSRGFIFGVDAFSDWPYYADPFISYEEKELTDPNVIRVGDLGQGKSAAITTGSMTRPLLLGRRSVFIDKKFDIARGQGEHAHKARALGVEPIKFSTDGTGVRINILDPVISADFDGHDEDPAAGDGDAVEKPTGQAQLLRAVVTEALERPMTPRDGKALRMAHETALKKAKAEGRVADIRDIVPALLVPDEQVCAAAHVSAAEAREWGLDVAFALERLIEDDLAGIVDGPTSADVVLGDGLTVFDVSRLPDDGPALGIVMLIISTWLANILYTQKRRLGRIIRTHLVIEEAWHLVRGAFALVIQRLMKLARALSLSCDFAFHHISDVPPGSPAAAMLKEAGTKYFYRQALGEEAAATVAMFALPPGTEEVLMGLDQGVCLIKVGTKDPHLVVHLRSDWEIELTNSDKAMLAHETPATA